jgi:hypothetical protein
VRNPYQLPKVQSELGADRDSSPCKERRVRNDRFVTPTLAPDLRSCSPRRSCRDSVRRA